MTIRLMPWLIVGVLSAASFCPTAFAQELSPPVDETKESALQEDRKSRQEIDLWQEKLESKKFSSRSGAMKELQEMGVDGIAIVEEIAMDGSLEASGRAFEILRIHHAGENEKLKAAATEALEQISQQTEHPRAATAEQILRPTESKADNPLNRLGLPLRAGVPNLQIRGLQIQGNGQIKINGNGNVRRTEIAVKVINGRRDVMIKEDDTKLHILEEEKGIRVERTDKNGKTTKKQYKDAAELKQKDPEAHKALEQHGKNAGMRANIQIHFGGAGGGLPPDLKKKMDEMRKQREARRDELQKRQEKLPIESQQESESPVVPPIETEQDVPASPQPQPKPEASEDDGIEV